jgi:hypothetical protein
MDFLKFVLISMLSSLILLTAVFSSPAQANVSGGELSLDSGAGPGSIYTIGTGAELKFETGDVHFNYTKQLSPSDPTATVTSEKHTDNWTGGFEQDLNEQFSMALDYDSLSDTDESLYSDGAKLTVSDDWAHLSFRYARSTIENNFLVYETATKSYRLIHGAFVYQATLEGTVDITLSDRDTLSPTVSYSFFNPDVTNFANLLSKRFATTLSNFDDTLQSFETWSVGANYNHDFDQQWSFGAVVTVSHLIIVLNPSIELNPSITRKWTKAFSTQFGIDYNYIPGEPTWTLNLGLKYDFKTKDESEDDDHQG